jgi:hypothetical protein
MTMFSTFKKICVPKFLQKEITTYYQWKSYFILKECFFDLVKELSL